MSREGDFPEREAPTDLHHEPDYPGTQTVIFSLARPDMTLHGPTDRCEIEGPHQTEDCREWG